MNCLQCNNATYEETFIQHKMECQNRLFNFEGVPARKCPECGHVFLEESVVRTLLFRTQKINQSQGIAYHKAKWGPELEEEAMQQDATTSGGDIHANQHKILLFIANNKQRLEDQKTTKKNILKLFKWTFNQETGVKKAQIVNEILVKIREQQCGVFTFSCKTSKNAAFETMEYVLVVTENDVWFYAQHDRHAPIYHLI
ncbi:MAG: hypothetical protein CSA21_01875 [Deltaproteobacteria bacterium]|nr:MAG: hypothetical protein CSA21_01875 [Deltaproteobacteria bacterium]